LDTAVSLAAQTASGELRGQAFNTTGSRIAVLELSNALSTATNVDVTVYESEGMQTSAQPGTLTLPPFATRHVVLNDYLADAAGSVAVRSATRASFIATVAEYGYDAADQIAWATTSRPRSGFGQALFGSYNNFLGGCRLRLVNLKNT